MSKQITKNQHYVPQCLLKHFCFDAKKGKKINIFDIERSVVRYNQSVKEVFSQNYFYGKDNEVETFMAENIEGSASKVLDKIVDGDFTIVDEDVLTLHRFILSLFYRTPEASERVSGFVNSQLESVVRELLSLNGFDPEEASAGRFNFYQDRLASLITVQGVLDSIILRDLDCHIIKNETASEFYISDHPVFIYNWLYRDLEHPGVTSITATGLQIFLPLSPQITLCLYDPKVYKYGQKSLVTCISKDEDIEILNSFQVINSDSIIGFHSKQNEAHVKQLYERYKSIKLHQYESGILSTQEEGEGKIRSTHFVFTRQAKLRKMPSFVKIKKEARSYASSYQERDPELSAKHMEFKKFINEQRQRSIIELNQGDL
ncbi:DUF4238 domain-containing protein [Desertifilum sp. FACHB-1129]|uniref:DUF4238 domain-containing protein n=1 Tax=Desertifilum tharense IPPAS B-1220 TaxID=1781255 RepID=A0A1E5QHI2_9CYAN|nr:MULTISPECIES: DUF4238 domain-containing protein [Desertifilum]MDA0210902.1 DUF4238 domain-containing protein [Cyanobacteria bacterium FC1]MBD2313495.1 DUF4238 domain-containing protein [Desertifilum sp. FACHB-1129]MBD2322366.1 DUF4238 domain-containing protein [Desertifilum sp. FACHB-866]MBD2332528.1 DUF4238 domain-containing protein [Desertifilum sp. FACHB-868]OEJ74047.1 hypothetical protein BH720_16615 [Desertifilum tharense IPPAS B-1220]